MRKADGITPAAGIYPATSSPVISGWTSHRKKYVPASSAGTSYTVAESVNDEIAEPLVVSPATAKTHVSRIMSKLDARDRAQVVVTAYETGLVRPGQRQPG